MNLVNYTEWFFYHTVRSKTFPDDLENFQQDEIYEDVDNQENSPSNSQKVNKIV